MVNEEGEQSREALTIYRDDFVATTSNKQLNFVQHVQSMLKINGRAAVVVPDNVLFEGGAGETVRRDLLDAVRRPHPAATADRHLLRAGREGERPLLRCARAASERPWTRRLWIYDLRTNMHFTLKTNPLARADLDDFVRCYHPENRRGADRDVVGGEPGRPLAQLRLRGADRAGQGEPRHLLAPRRVAR